MKALYILFPFLYLLGVAHYYKPMNFMNEEQLIAILRPQLEKAIKTPWSKIVFYHLHEDEFAHEGFTVWKNDTEKYTVEPDEYNLAHDVQDAIVAFIKTRESPCNRITVTLYPNQTYTIKQHFDKKAHEANKRMLASKAKREKTKLHTDLTNTPIDYTRFKLVPASNARERFNEFDFNGKILCTFFVRLYSILGDTPKSMYEGFHYDILDTEQGYLFSAALTASGPYYYTSDHSKKAKRAVEDFHDMVFSKHLELKDCTYTYEHDFGTSTFGYKDGKMLCD